MSSANARQQMARISANGDDSAAVSTPPLVVVVGGDNRVCNTHTHTEASINVRACVCVCGAPSAGITTLSHSGFYFAFSNRCWLSGAELPAVGAVIRQDVAD